MQKFSKWLEALHAYDDPDWNTKFQPLKTGDTVRCFHGFNSFVDAYRAAIYGLTGREYADRRYSYESDNNPYGLFVTLSFKKATEFVSAVSDQAIMEFIAKEEDLEPPVWPGGSYTVQGGMSQYFGHGRKNQIGRRQRRKMAGNEVEDFLKKNPNTFQYIRQSDDKYKANILLNSTEYQALFVGDLNPQDIAAFHVRAKDAPYNTPFTRLTREEFLHKYKDYKDEAPRHPGNSWIKAGSPDPNWNGPPKGRIFLPSQEFNGDKFLQSIKSKFGEDPDEILNRIWGLIARGQRDKKDSFMNYFKNLLWPKQYAKAMWFLKSRYGKGEE